MSKNHYFVLVFGGRCMGGNTDRERLERMLDLFGEGTEIVQVEGDMPSDLSEVASRFYAAQEAEERAEAAAMLEMTEEERQELLDAIESPEVRAMFERPVDLSPFDDMDDCDSTHVTSRSGLFLALKAVN